MYLIAAAFIFGLISETMACLAHFGTGAIKVNFQTLPWPK